MPGAGGTKRPAEVVPLPRSGDRLARGSELVGGRIIVGLAGGSARGLP
jgi:hypothetical protein